jgi:putative membrane protein
MMHGFDGGGFHSGFGIAGGIIMMVFWVAVLIAIILFVVWLVRQTQVGGSTVAPPLGHSGEPALDILKRRYAQGEIDTSEFEEKKKVLGG